MKKYILKLMVLCILVYGSIANINVPTANAFYTTFDAASIVSGTWVDANSGRKYNFSGVTNKDIDSCGGDVYGNSAIIFQSKGGTFKMYSTYYQDSGVFYAKIYLKSAKGDWNLFSECAMRE